MRESSVPGNWEDADERRNRREADLLSLHESVGNNNEPTRRLRQRRGNGDITGGGSGSGLSRWTLLRSWWTGKGSVRLPDSDDEDEDLDATRSVEEDGENTSEGGAISRGLRSGEEDAVIISLDAAPVSPSATISSRNTASEAATTLDDEGLAKEERRSRRRARRRARELGLSIEDYEEGLGGEPQELHTPTQFDFGRRPLPSKSSQASSNGSIDFVLVDTSTSKTIPNGSHGFDFGLLPPTVEEGGMDGGEELFGRKKSRSSRKAGGSPTISGESRSASGSQSASDHRGSSNGSREGGSSRHRSSRNPVANAQQQYLSPSDYPLPSSPSSSVYASSSSRLDGKRPRHRQHPSVSSTSTSSSSRHLSKKSRSPLEAQAELPEENHGYFEDQYGQLQYVPNHPSEGDFQEEGQHFVDEQGQQFWIPNSQLHHYQQQQQALDSHQDFPHFQSANNLSAAPSPALDDLYSHIAPAPLLSPHPRIDPVDDDAATETEGGTAREVEVESQFAEQEDPLAFLRALKGTKVPVVAPVPRAEMVQGASVDSKLATPPEEDDAGHWGGIKLAGWNDAEGGEGTGLDRWINRDEEEEEDSADD